MPVSKENALTRISTESKYKDFRMFYINQITDLNALLTDVLSTVEIVTDKNGKHLLDCPMSFDIETTAITTPDYRHATMYHWQILINNLIVLGRTWDEWFTLIETLCYDILIPNKVWAVIYVHNLAYEFQFIRKFFEWRQVFARKARAPIFAETMTNIQFRCSYFLCNTSLAEMTKDYGFEIAKESDYDYDKLRHCKTPMTEQEIRYCVHDVAALYYFINSERARNGNIANIPYTQTSYVRRELRTRCYPPDNPFAGMKYREMISSLTISPAEYFMLKRAYFGGFTHASVINVCETHKNVKSFDRASAYPTSICSEKFPMSTSKYAEEMTLERYHELLESDHCIIADFDFENIRAKQGANEHYIPIHKCRNRDGKRLKHYQYEDDNSKLIEAPYIQISLTDVDFDIIKLYYDYDSVTITNAYVYEAGFLPKQIIQLCIDLYTAKTTLKGVEGREDEYLRSKQMLNSIYGMMVTDIVQDDIVYTSSHKWDSDEVDVEAVVTQYNTQKERTLFYPWGVYITAYARRELLETIWAMGYDYIYSDTDSVKILNAKAHMPYFKAYNEYITHRINHILTVYNIDTNGSAPKDPKGKKHPLGHFELDEDCTRFKTLGAKRYLYEHDGKLTMTVAGVNKLKGSAYLKAQKNPFEAFDYGLVFPADVSGKMVATYVDDPIEGTVDDGETVEPYEELSCTHLMTVEYHMDVADDYLHLQNLLLDRS